MMNDIQSGVKHLAIIMDGNRRWARARGLPEVEGHRHGLTALRSTVRESLTSGIEYLTVWAFSTKNFKRSPGFIKDIMQVFRETLDNKKWWDELREQQVVVRILGNLDLFPADIGRRIQERLVAQEDSETAMVLSIGLGYEGRDEIIRAGKKLLAAGDEFEEERMATYLDTAGMPDPDLMIRTGGEQRLSGYLLWQLADAELYFTDCLWPDFDGEHLRMALLEYAGRERRFGT